MLLIIILVGTRLRAQFVLERSPRRLCVRNVKSSRTFTQLQSRSTLLPMVWEIITTSMFCQLSLPQR